MSGSGYLHWSYDPFEKLVIFPPNPQVLTFLPSHRMGIVTIIAPVLLPLLTWHVCAVALVLSPLSRWHCHPWCAGIIALIQAGLFALVVLTSCSWFAAFLPLLSWHVLSHRQHGRPCCRQCQHQPNKVNNASTTSMATPAQSGPWCQHKEGDNASVIDDARVTKSWCQRNAGDNTVEVIDATVECGYNYLRLLLYANWQHIWTAYQCAQTLCKYLRWMGEAVWVGCQPQTWHNHIISTPQP